MNKIVIKIFQGRPSGPQTVETVLCGLTLHPPVPNFL